MVRNIPSNQSLRSSLPNRTTSSTEPPRETRPQPEQPQRMPSSKAYVSQDDYSRYLRDRVATGLATEGERDAYHQATASSLPSIPNLLHTMPVNLESEPTTAERQALDFEGFQKVLDSIKKGMNQRLDHSRASREQIQEPLKTGMLGDTTTEPHPLRVYNEEEIQRRVRDGQGLVQWTPETMKDTEQRYRVLLEEQRRSMGYGTKLSIWELGHNSLFDKHPIDWVPMERDDFERLWEWRMEKQGLAQTKPRGLAATLAANEEAERFKRATSDNAAKYTKPFCEFLTENPTVFHCVDAMKKQLKEQGWTQLSEREAWDIKTSGHYFVERNGSSLIAFVVGANYKPGNGAAILAGHVDALTAKLKPVSQVANKAGYLQLGVAPYAGGLNSTWWDRDLGIGGRVHIKEGDKIVTKLVKLDWPIARIPTLAPHFGAAANGPFNPETQMVPIIGLDSSSSDGLESLYQPADAFSQPSLLGTTGFDGKIGSFISTQPPALVRAIGDALGLGANTYSNIVNWELELFDIQPATVGGLNKEFIFAGRIDDKLCSWAALQALIESQTYDTRHSSLIKVVGLFDDEEIGSLLRQGAKGNFLPSTIERAVGALSDHSPTSDLMGRTMANSFMVSSDVIHAVNPNFLNAYLENHSPHLNVGVVVSADSNGHMTTDSVSTTILKRCADKVGAKLQVFQIRNDSRSGGTVGPMLSSALGCRAIDAGIPQLSMHSIRATTGSLDPGLGVLCFLGFLNGFESVDREMQDS